MVLAVTAGAAVTPVVAGEAADEAHVHGHDPPPACPPTGGTASFRLQERAGSADGEGALTGATGVRCPA